MQTGAVRWKYVCVFSLDRKYCLSHIRQGLTFSFSKFTRHKMRRRISSLLFYSTNEQLYCGGFFDPPSLRAQGFQADALISSEENLQVEKYDEFIPSNLLRKAFISDQTEISILEML